MNSTKVARTSRTSRTTIFKLIGPCEILSHGQKVCLKQETGVAPSFTNPPVLLLTKHHQLEAFFLQVV